MKGEIVVSNFYLFLLCNGVVTSVNASTSIRCSIKAILAHENISPFCAKISAWYSSAKF